VTAPRTLFFGFVSFGVLLTVALRMWGPTAAEGRPTLDGGPALAATTVTVVMGSSGSIYGPFWFCDSSHNGSVCTTTIAAGDSVTWQNTTSVAHTSTECGATCGSFQSNPLWSSGDVAPNDSYSREFDDAGTFNYQCAIHPFEMLGKIVVTGSGGATATTTTTRTRTPTPTRTATPAGHAGDVNCDGRSDAVDAALLLQRSAGLLASLSCAQNADVNHDGNVNAVDAALVLQYVAGLLHSLPS
jgi:hypothetical protein